MKIEMAYEGLINGIKETGKGILDKDSSTYKEIIKIWEQFLKTNKKIHLLDSVQCLSIFFTPEQEESNQ